NGSHETLDRDDHHRTFREQQKLVLRVLLLERHVVPAEDLPLADQMLKIHKAVPKPGLDLRRLNHLGTPSATRREGSTARGPESRTSGSSQNRTPAPRLPSKTPRARRAPRRAGGRSC